MARKTKLTAGPTPDGTFVTRTTDNPYTHAVIVIDHASIVYRPRDPNADMSGYIVNPSQGKWISLSWHTRYDLAVKAASKRDRALVVPVVEPMKFDDVPTAPAGYADAVDTKDIRNELINMALANGMDAQKFMRNSFCIRRANGEPIFTVTITAGGSLVA